MTLTPRISALVEQAGLDPVAVKRVAQLALAEDLAAGVDVTTEATIPEDHQGIADVVAHASGIVAGIPIAAAIFELRLGGQGSITPRVADGVSVTPGEVLLTAAGPTRALLTAERSALNLLCHLSGVATLTRRWVDAVAGTQAIIRDTRKTTPGLRTLEKYAVRCGGGRNHRMGLADQALIKDNHVHAVGGVVPALTAVRRAYPGIVCEVECDTVDQVRQALAAGARLVLLDNMDLDDLRQAVVLARQHGAQTEASGGLTLDNVTEVAATGVGFLAVGALTHSAPALDLGLDLR